MAVLATLGLYNEVHLSDGDPRRQRPPVGFALRYGSSLSDPWIPLEKCGPGITSDANPRDFVTYFAIGFN
jgi:hypothetical protein